MEKQNGLSTQMTDAEAKVILALANKLGQRWYSLTDVANKVSKDVCYTTARKVGERVTKFGFRNEECPYAKIERSPSRYSLNKLVDTIKINQFGVEILLDDFRKTPDTTKRRNKTLSTNPISKSKKKSTKKQS